MPIDGEGVESREGVRSPGAIGMVRISTSLNVRASTT